MRGLAIDVAGRLSVKNPAYVMPQLRRHLVQLLNDMDHSPDSLQREGGRWLNRWSRTRCSACQHLAHLHIKELPRRE